MAMIGIRHLTLLAVLLVALFGLAQVVLGSNIDPTDKWAWSTNAGWINFDPQCTGCQGVAVYSDHLEGYAWGENIRWIHVKGDTHGVAMVNRLYLPPVPRDSWG